MFKTRTPAQADADKSVHIKAASGDVPGPTYEAVARLHFERGSKEVGERNRWKLMCIILGLAMIANGIAFYVLIPLKTTETVLVSKASNGNAVAELATPDWKPDRAMMAAFANAWVGYATEINIATWERSINRATYEAIGVARDQLRDLLNKPENNPALLVKDAPAFVREYEPGTVNFVSDNVVLVRYRTISRPSPGAQKVIKDWAMTLTLQRNKAQSIQDALYNPTGLVVTNFSVSEEIK